MTPEVLVALRRIVDEIGADAGVLVRLSPSGAAVVTSSTLAPRVVVGDQWGVPGALAGPHEAPELAVDPARVADLVPTAARLALPTDVTAALVAPLPDTRSLIVLLWAQSALRPDVLGALASGSFHRFTLLAPLLDAQVQAQEAASRLQSVVTALDQAIVLTATGSGKVDANAAAVRLLGLDSGTLESAELADALRALRERAVDPAALDAEADFLLDSPAAAVRDWLWVLRGEPSHLRVTTVPVHTITGSGRLWVFDDISAEMALLERERSARAALGESEHRYRVLAENVSDVVVEGTTTGGLVWVSPSVTSALGWSPDELAGTHFVDLVHAADLPLVNDALPTLEAGHPVTFEVRLRTAAGGHRWMNVRVKPVLGPGGEIVGRVAGWWDSQASHEAMERLGQSEHRYRVLAENVSDIVMLGTPDGILTWVSPSVTATLGWAPEDILGTAIVDFVRDDHLPVLQRVMEQTEHGEYVTVEVPIRTASGDHRWMELRARLLFDGEGRVVGRVGALWDTHASHEAREQLEQSERRYRLLRENTSEVVFQTVDGLVTWVSPAIEEVTGWPADEVVGSSTETFWHEDDWDRISGLHDDAREGTHGREVLRLRTPEGSYRWMEVVIRPYTEPDGRPATVGMMYDVSERVAAQEAARASEERYRMLLENSNDVVFQSLDGVLQWISLAVEAVTGYLPEELLGQTTAHLWHPDDLPLATRMREGTADEAVDRQALRLRCADGRYRWMEVTVRRTLDADGRSGLVGMMHDVSERVAAQEAARASEERYRMVAEKASDVVCRYRPDGTIEWIFGSTEAFVGRSAQEMVGTALDDYFLIEDWGDRDDVRARLARGEAVQLLARLRHVDGSTRWVEVRAQAAVGPDGSLESLIGTMRDAQAEVDYREALAASERQARDLVDAYEAARDEAIRASSAKTAFLSRMSHELRTPLNAVLGFAQLLSLDPLTDEQAEAVQHIRTGGRHLLDLINEIVDISRIEAGRLSLTMGTVDAPGVLADAVELVRPLALQHDVDVVGEPATARVPDVHADRQRVTQVLLNLMSNAVKYNRPHGSVRVRCRPGAPGEVVFEVSDTGPGIPEQLLPRLFEPFDRLGAERSDVEGTGIGLALADALARAMGGRIEVSTEVGEGSTFSLVLRAAPAEPSAVAPAGDEPDARLDSRLHILYIEDNPTNATLMARVVELRPGSRLEVAVDGVHGVEAASAQAPDLVFLDLHLPDLSGEEVLDRLRRLPGCAGVPIVVVTADASPRARERMSALGCDGFLTKPFDVDDVLGWIDATASDHAAG